MARDPRWEAPADLNIAEYFLDRRIAEGRGDRIALRGAFGELTYHEVQGLANRFAQALARWLDDRSLR